MEVDGVDNWIDNSEGGKFLNLKTFVNAVRDFESTYNETSINLMTRSLGIISSTCDLSIFSPGRPEVCAFFSSLWRVMSHKRGPHWAGLAVLARATSEPSARHALTHTYKFLPVLSRLLSDSISNDKKIKLLSVMQDISYGIKISWQETYLMSLLKQLTDWIMQPLTDPQHRTIGHKSLTVLVNVCYGNQPAINALMSTIDTKEFVVHLINLKDNEYGGVEVCRLLVCLSGGGASGADVHSCLRCTLRTFVKAVAEQDETQLLHAYTFLNDLSSDSNLRSYVVTYPDFLTPLQEALKLPLLLCQGDQGDGDKLENSINCLRHVLQFLTVLYSLELYSLRDSHLAAARLCRAASHACLPEALKLFAALLAQYRDEGQLPPELAAAVNPGLQALIAPPALESDKAGVPWLQVVAALCELREMQERVLHEVAPDVFEDILYSVLHHTSQSGRLGTEQAAAATLTAMRAVLALAPGAARWDAALHRLLEHHQVRKMLCAGLTGNNANMRRQILQLVKHHYFPSDLLSQVFGEIPNMSDSSIDSSSVSTKDVAEVSPRCCGWLAPVQEHAVDALVNKLAEALHDNKISDITISSVMELYGYKIMCLEQSLHADSVALQSAGQHVAALQHAAAALRAGAARQLGALCDALTTNDKHKQTIEELHKQLKDAETTLRGFKAKLATERLDKELQKDHLQRDFQKQLTTMEEQIKVHEKEAKEKIRQAELELKAVQKKLDQQTSKNSELAGVLVKFEERVKQRDKKLEEAVANEHALRKEIDSRELTVKQLEKTVLERENRLYQVTTQLDEMKRVQEMVAKLMSKSSNAPQ